MQVKVQLSVPQYVFTNKQKIVNLSNSAKKKKKKYKSCPIDSIQVTFSEHKHDKESYMAHLLKPEVNRSLHFRSFGEIWLLSAIVNHVLERETP